MGSWLGRLGGTAVAGLLVLLPIGLVAFILVETFGMLGAIADPIAELLPIERIGQVDVRHAVALLLIAGFCLVLGALVQTGGGARANAWAEEKILARLPGYTMARSLTRGVAGSHEESAFPVALVRLYGGEAATLALIVEEHPDGFMTVFVPQAPTPTLGSVFFVATERVERLAVPATTALNCVMQWGLGSAELLERRPGRAAAQVPADSRETGASETTE